MITRLRHNRVSASGRRKIERAAQIPPEDRTRAFWRRRQRQARKGAA